MTRSTSPARRWWPIALIAVVAIVPYLGVLGHPLVHDDRLLIRGNAFLAHDAGAISVFRHDFWYGSRVAGGDLYRPLTVLSIAWGARLGSGVWPLRLVNLLLHALVAVQLALTLAALASRRAGPAAADPVPAAAWAGAALFAVHPLSSEAVIWINGRSELLAALFGLLAFRRFVALADRSEPGGRTLAASVLWFLAALCSKESAVAWVVIAALWYALFRREIAAPPRAVAVRALAYAGALALFLLARGAAVGWRRAPVPFVDNPLGLVDAPARVVNAILLLGRYLGKAVWPRTLSIDWTFDQIPVRAPGSAAGLAALALVVAWVATGVLLARRNRTAAFLFGSFFAAFAVTSNVLFPIGTLFGERLAYLPLAGACGLAGLALASLPLRRGMLAALVAVLAVAGGARVAVRTLDFRSSEAIYRATVRTSPRAVKSLATLGQILLLVEGRPDEAIPYLERAVEIWPDYPRPWGLLAEANRRLGHAERAAECAARADEAARKLRDQAGVPDSAP